MPTVASTTQATREECRHALAAGMKDFLRRPRTLARVRESLQRVTLPEAPRRRHEAASAGAAG